MKLTAKLLKKIIQEQVDELDTKEKKRERYKIYTAKVKAGKKLSPAENEDYLKIASVLDPVDYNKFQDKLDPFDYSMVQEEDRDGDMPKRLSPKEKFGEFQNFVELNGISMEQLEAMALLQQKFMKLHHYPQAFLKKFPSNLTKKLNGRFKLPIFETSEW